MTKPGPALTNVRAARTNAVGHFDLSGAEAAR